jgi:hypothetical protein
VGARPAQQGAQGIQGGRRDHPAWIELRRHEARQRRP